MIHLSYHQAQAVAERAARICRLSKHPGYGFKGTERVIVTVENAYTTPDTHGTYMRVENSQSAPVPLFAKDLGRERDFAAERLPARDENGHVFHLDMNGIGDDEFDMGPQLRALGWLSTTVDFESDADEAARD